MKSLKLLAIIDKKKPILTFNNLIPVKDKHNVRLMKGEKIVQVEVKMVK